MSQSTISLVERGHFQTLSVEGVRRIAAALDIRVELIGRWRGGDAGPLLGRRHSMLAESFASFVAAHEGWVVEPEVSFAIYGERGIIDQLAWNADAGHLLVVEFETAFVDVNEMLGTLDRKRRLIRPIVAERGWQPRAVSVWLIVSDTRTNRRHAIEHTTLLRSKSHGAAGSFGRYSRTRLGRPAAWRSGQAATPVVRGRVAGIAPVATQPFRGPPDPPRAWPLSLGGNQTPAPVPIGGRDLDRYHAVCWMAGKWGGSGRAAQCAAEQR